MIIRFEHKNNNLIIYINGEIDHHISNILRERIEFEMQKTNSDNIIFEFKDVKFMDSSGIGMVIGRYKNIISIGGRVAISSTNETIEKIFKASGLYKIIEKYENLEDALKAIGGC